MEAFLVEAKPWALRQARKRFPHIPQDLYEDVYQQACIEMWQRGPTSTDKRSMYAYLAKVLNGTLGRTHKSWVHDHAQLTHEDGEPIALPDSGPEPDSQYDRRHLNALLSELMNRRLLAPEKAVLQLQLGAGLDPEQVREALDMTPRQYKRRRSEGLEKLRSAIDDYLQGRVCEDHAGLLAMAATGDLPAGSAEQLQLHAHLEHCGACRGEIRRLRSTVAQRFAFAPWPIAITAPGMLAAKGGILGSLFGGAKAGGLGAAKLAATAATVAVVAGGGAVALTSDDDSAPSVRETSAPAAATATPEATRGKAATGTTSRSERRRSQRRERRSDRNGRRDARHGGDTATGGTTPAGADTAATTTSPASGGNAVTDVTNGVTDAVRDTTGAVRDTTRGITENLPALPAPTPDVQGAVDGVTGAVDDVTGAVDGVLNP